MKKKIFVLAVVLLLVSVMTSGTLAYYTTNTTARNVITSSGVNILIEEWQQTSTGQVSFPGAAIPVMPATSVSKIVTLRNQEAQSFVRARLELILTDSRGNAMDVDAEIMRNLIHLDMNTTDWTLKDGWWYYRSALDTGASTDPLMTEVTFDGPNMTNEYQSCTLRILVYAQAVQTAHNGTSATEALGWPTTE